ncbi:hypothetical protein DYB32_006290 [Aphanomyces invadans]|uniref:CID domain-containing protein n=1 Tax=Aphanomyces invadans TaxID=157072 RepID=A0A418ASE1_9STRA|nr:hypothetical protein DYB32_006290 [Aphanomyces invadans]
MDIRIMDLILRTSEVPNEWSLRLMSGWKGEEELKGALASLASAKGVSANRIKAACTTCMKWSKEYKRVVHAVEMAMWKSDVEHRLAYMYLIDALIRASQTKYGDEKDHFAKRFGQHLHHTLAACRKAPDDHKVWKRSTE